MPAIIFIVTIAIIAYVANAHKTTHTDPAEHVENLVSELQDALYNSFSYDKSTHRRLQGTPTMVNINQYYMATSYGTFDSNNLFQPTCDATNGKRLSAIGYGIGCLSFAGVSVSGVSASDIPGSMQLTCYNVNGANIGGVAFGATLYNGNTCTGDQFGLSDSLQQQFNSIMSSYKGPTCSTASGAYPLVINCAGNYVPASLSNGYRTSTYNSPTCMGNPFQFIDMYSYPGNPTYSCSNGNVMQSGVSIKYDTCTTQKYPSTTSYESAGCLSPMTSLTTRTYYTWNMYSVVNGVTLSDWNSNPSYAQAFVTAVAMVCNIDYTSISAISASSTGTTTVQVSITIFVQPGFGNTYAAPDVYTNILANYNAAFSCQGTNCVPSLTSSFRLFANVKQVNSWSGLSVSPSTTQPTAAQTTTLSSPPAPTGQPPAPTAAATSSKQTGMIVGIVVGVLVFFGAIGYYCKGQKDTQAALAAADANANTTVKNPVRV